ncbi:MAG TPA: NAD(P)H-hydrate dehydratase [Dehalococcoidia bacterium]|nr:NAD(P)H-hydrate dehydratase [Dehalococcoidia bacterium]
MKIVTAAQMSSLERAAQRRGVSLDGLMEQAGLAVAQAARRELGQVAGARVLALIGPGNNGADGLVAARHLARWGAQVTAYIVTRRPDPDPKQALARQYGVEVAWAAQDPGLAGLDRMLAPNCRLVIDAVLGTGRSRPLDGVVREVLARLEAMRSMPQRPLVLALDLPSGLNADTGQVDPACPTADLTMALGFPKVGLLTFPGASRVGRLEVADIGLPPGLEEEDEIALELLTDSWASRSLPARPLNSHKGTFGHVLAVAGSRNYVGAACLACQAAVRAGAGLVTLAAPESVDAIAAGKLTEVIHLPLPEDQEGRIHPDAAPLIRDQISRYTTLLVGCGLGWSKGTTQFIDRLLLADPPLTLPTVVDADGLNNLARLPDWWRRLGGPTVLTPHPGEMATLTRLPTLEVQQDRVAVARQWAARWNVVVALKGAHTAVAEPGGLVRLAPFANPGLASGGTGDVLTGVIAALLAQGMIAHDAASLGVYLHGLAAEAVGRRLGDTGAIASDLLEELPRTIHRLRLSVEGLRRQAAGQTGTPRFFEKK